MIKAIANYLKRTLGESWIAFYELLKFLVPVIILVKIGVEIGLVEWLGQILSPVMSTIGLSGELGLVWATSLLTNIYAGLITLSTLSNSSVLTVGQFTIICTMILIAHSIPIETAIARKCGINASYLVLLRIVTALIAAYSLNLIYADNPIYQEQLSFQLGEDTTNQSILEWAWGESIKVSIIFVIIFALILVMDLLRITKVEKLILYISRPFLKPLGITAASSNLLTAAMLLGMSYGGALIIQESKTGKISKRELFAVITFLTLAHALVEETIITTAFGAHFNGVLLTRVLLAYIITLAIIRFPRLVERLTH